MKKLPLLLCAMLGWSVVPVLVGAEKPSTTAPSTTVSKTAPAGKTVSPPSQTAPKTTLPAGKPAKPAAAATEKEEPLVGKLLDRASGGFLNLKVDNGNFVVRFLDADKKEIPPDLVRAIVRYRQHLQNRQHLLTLSGGKVLRAPTPVEKPYRFTGLSLVLFKEGSEGAAEAYTLYFNQPMPGDGSTVSADEMTPEQAQKAAK